MRTRLAGASLVTVALAAAGFGFGWGVGLFDPCGLVDRVVRLSTCRIVETLEDHSVEALLPFNSDRLLVAVRAAGPDAATPPSLAELDLAEGTWSAEVDLPALPANASWSYAALATDGGRLVVAMLDEPTRVLDRSTGEVLAELPLYGLGPLDFAGPDAVRLATDAASLHGAPRPAARVFGALDGIERPSVDAADALPLFRQGVSRALSPDGTLLAQHVRTRADTGIVAVRLTEAAAPDTDGDLLVAPLSAWLPEGQLFPWLSFSTSGAYLAASFDSAPVWGRATSALLVWDVATRALVARVPTRGGRWENLVWREEPRELLASRFEPDSRRGEIAVIKY